MKTIFQNNKHPYTFMNVSTSDKKFSFFISLASLFTVVNSDLSQNKQQNL